MSERKFTEIEEDDPDAQVIAFPNPNDEEMKRYTHDAETAEEHYLNAKELRSTLISGTEELVGAFISAALDAELDDDYEQLEELVEKIKK